MVAIVIPLNARRDTRLCCVVCGERLSRAERERFTSYCADDVPGLSIRFEPAPADQVGQSVR